MTDWRPTHIVRVSRTAKIPAMLLDGRGWSEEDWQETGSPSWTVDGAKWKHSAWGDCTAAAIGEEVEPAVFALLRRVSKRTVERYLDRGLPHRKEGRKVLIPTAVDVGPYAGEMGRPKAGSGRIPALVPDAVRVRFDWGDGTFAEGALYLGGEGYFASSETRQGYSDQMREICRQLKDA